MMSFSTQTLEADLHRLDLRFASLRIRQPRAVERLARSIEQSGQLVPLVAVAEAAQWVLIDGFRRLDALRRLGRDTARMDLWDCPLDQALLIVLVRLQGRTWEADRGRRRHSGIAHGVRAFPAGGGPASRSGCELGQPPSESGRGPA
jgi:hypothetical protein